MLYFKALATLVAIHRDTSEKEFSREDTRSYFVAVPAYP
jgi:hypothetical protein